MVFCLAKSFVPRVLIDFEIFQYQFAPNCIRRRGRDEAPPCVGGDHLCARPRYIYSSRIQGRRNGRPSRILSPPLLSPSPEEGRVRLPPSSSSSSFLSSPPPLSLFPFYFSRFNRFLPLFTVLLLAPRHPPSPAPPLPPPPPPSPRVPPLPPSTIFLNSSGF